MKKYREIVEGIYSPAVEKERVWLWVVTGVIAFALIVAYAKIHGIIIQ